MKKIILWRSFLRLLKVITVGAFMSFIPRLSYGYGDEPRTNVSDTIPTFSVDGQIALHSLMSISDAHLQKLADILSMLAATDDARSGDWNRIRVQLAEAARINVPAVYWFASSDGTYWTLDQGHVAAKLSDRDYFPRLMAGQTVMGQLVVSRSTNRNTAIVAVPIRGTGNPVIGAVGCSIYLDSLSALVRMEMGLEDRLFFYSFDASPLVALHSDPTIIFIEPMKQEDEGLQQAFRQMLSGKKGVVNYTFRGVRRTVLYNKSSITGWWYGLGMMAH